MHRIYELKDEVIREIAKHGEKDKKDFNDYQMLDVLAHLGKNLCKIIEACEEEEEEYSEGSYGGRVNFRGNTSMAGNRGGMGTSMARGRGRYAKRDAMGRYSSADNFRMDFEHMLNEAPNEMVRQKLMEIMNTPGMM